MNRRYAVFAALLACLATAAPAEELQPLDTETLDAFKERVEKSVLDLEITEPARKEVKAQPTIAVPSGGFADRVNDSLRDFLPLFQFAVNAVNTSDDRKSVTVNFNPLRLGRDNPLALQATVTDPEPSEQLLDAIREPARVAQREILDEKISDFGDITWSLAYGYQTSADGRSWDDVKSGRLRRMWGRDPALYEDLLQGLIDAAWDAIQSESRVDLILEQETLMNDEILVPLMGDTESDIDPDAVTFGDMRNGVRRGAIEQPILDRLIDVARRESLAFAAQETTLDSYGLADLGKLLVNQPQLVFSATYRDRDELVGPTESNATFRIEWGRRNFNRVFRTYRKMSQEDGVTPLDALKAAVEGTRKLANDSFAFSASYRDRDAYAVSYAYEEAVTDPATGDEIRIPRAAELSFEDSREVCAMLQWSHMLVGQQIQFGDVVLHPKLDVALEYVDVSDDPTRQDRAVGRVTYSYPISDALSVPVSLSYASDPELLGDQNEKFSAHFGLSYKLQRNSK